MLAVAVWPSFPRKRESISVSEPRNLSYEASARSGILRGTQATRRHPVSTPTRHTGKQAALDAMVEELHIGQVRRHILLCSDQTKPKCCPKALGLKSWDFLKARLAELGLVDAGGVYRSKANCLRVCVHGPVALVYPDGTWYPLLHARGARTYHPGTSDRRPAGGRIRLRGASAAGRRGSGHVAGPTRRQGAGSHRNSAREADGGNDAAGNHVVADFGAIGAAEVTLT